MRMRYVAQGAVVGTVTAWIRNYPVGAFLLWFFTVGWTITFMPLVARRALHMELLFQPFALASNMMGLLLPLVVITHVVDGPEGVHLLLHRLLKVRASVGWYTVALVAVPVTALVLVRSIFGPSDASPSTLFSALVGGLILQTIIGCITNNLWEEAGLMGFVQARWQSRHGAFVAAIYTAPLFTLQHLAIVVNNGNGLILSLVFILALSALAIPFRALLAWVDNRTDSLFLVGLLHAAGNAVAGGSGLGDGLLPRLYENNTIVLFHLVAEAIVGLVVITGTRA